MINLFNAIVLEVGFRTEGPCRIDNELSRREFWLNQVIELRKNSNFTTDAEFRVITAAHIIDAVRIKLDAHFRALRAEPGFVLHYTNGGLPYAIKNSYCREGDARRVMTRLNARQGGGYSVSSRANYIAATRARLVFSAMNRAVVMETTGTNYSCSVASEAYWAS